MIYRCLPNQVDERSVRPTDWAFNDDMLGRTHLILDASTCEKDSFVTRGASGTSLRVVTPLCLDSFASLGRWSVQITRIEDLHSRGYVWRGVRPDNFW